MYGNCTDLLPTCLLTHPYLLTYLLTYLHLLTLTYLLTASAEDALWREDTLDTDGLSQQGYDEYVLQEAVQQLQDDAYYEAYVGELSPLYQHQY